jgi:hypothetical protein
MNSVHIIKRVWRKIDRISYIPWDVAVFFRGISERKTFADVSSDIAVRLKRLSAFPFEQYVTPHWHRMNARMESVLVSGLPYSFLRNGTIGYTMFVSTGGAVLSRERAYLETRFSREELKMILRENSCGAPYVRDRRYCTSHNSIRHLYSIARWIESTKTDVEKLRTIVEWGGGYGNMAKLFFRLSPSIHTYVIIDTPLFSLIQQAYLCAVLGKDRVHLWDSPDATFVEGKINLVPVAFVESLRISADLFVSTWALSESSAYAQKRMIERKCFDAKHILIAFQHANQLLPESEGVRDMVARLDVMEESIPDLPGNGYLFK